MKTNFRPDKRGRREPLSPLQFALSLFGCILVFVLAFFGSRLLFSGVSSVLGAAALLPGISDVTAHFASNTSLSEENGALKERLSLLEDKARIFSLLVRENAELKSELSRKEPAQKILLARVLSHPDHSLYDTLIVDRGSEDGVIVGQQVLAYPHTLLGTVAEVSPHSAKIELLSTPNHAFSVLIGASLLPAEAHGRGGGVYGVTVPKDLAIVPGDSLYVASRPDLVIAVVGAVDPGADSSSHLLLARIPANIFEIPRVFISLTP